MAYVVAAWERHADCVLHRAAALCRIVAGVPPRDFAGLYVGDDEIDGLLRRLPGLDGPGIEDVEQVRNTFAPLVSSARAGLLQWLRTGDDPLALAARAARLTLRDAEVLSLLTAVELSPQRQRLVAYLQDSVQLPRITVATMSRILADVDAAQNSLARSSPLRRGELVTVENVGPWAVRMCGIPSRLAWAVLGDASPDPNLPGDARILLHQSHRAQDSSESGLLLIHGADRQSRRLAAGRAHEGRSLLATPIPANDAEWEALIREATICSVAVVVEVDEPLNAKARTRLEESTHLNWVISSHRELPLDCLPERAWTELAVADGRAQDEDWLNSFGVNAPAGVRVSREQLRLVTAASGADPGQVGRAVRRLAGGHLDRLAVRIQPRRTWGDLVLHRDLELQLRDLAARHEHRNLVYGGWGFPTFPSIGVVALFAGPSGTGKTLAAEVVAGSLGLDLYKIDLSAVVSKYIGETEKNLERIFEAAATGELVLFFDEADALFGKRSEVSDAHDRYANIEVAYLLQRLEAFDGIVVLATNLQGNIDQAFLRRIAIAVNFPAPDEQQRRAIWQCSFPAHAPVADLDLDFLAGQFEVTGGVIHNAALASAFLAAQDGAPITMERIAIAMKREFQKLGRVRTETEFGPYFDLVTQDFSTFPVDVSGA
jgi:hypothetical protein